MRRTQTLFPLQESNIFQRLYKEAEERELRYEVKRWVAVKYTQARTERERERQRETEERELPYEVKSSVVVRYTFLRGAHMPSCCSSVSSAR